MDDYQEETNQGLFDSLTDEEERDFLEEIGVGTPKPHREIIEGINARASRESNDFSPEAIQEIFSKHFTAHPEDFNKLPVREQMRHLENLAASNIGTGKSAHIEQIAENVLQRRFEHSSAAYETYKRETSEVEQTEKQPTNACGDVIGENGLPLINEKAFDAFKNRF